MATVDVPRSKKRDGSQPAKAPQKKSRAFRYGCYITVLGLAAGLYFAPLILAHTPLGAWAIGSALKLDGTVSFGSASLGWFSSVTAENLEIRDPAGEKVLEVASLRSEKPLIGLLLDFSDLGQIQVERPVLHVVAAQEDSNIERVFGALWTGESSGQVAVHLQINEGTIAVDDVPAGHQFRIEDLALDCTISGTDNSIALTTSGAVADQRQPGNFKILLRTKASSGSESAVANGQIDCQTSALPLELTEPVLRRFVDRATVSGRLSTRLGGAWGEMAEGGETSVRGESLVTGLAFSAAALGSDRIELERIEIPCHIVQRGELVQIDELAINCDLGQISLSGSAKMSDFSAANKLMALAHENYELKGHADLAELARRLPQTLRIREGTEITSGNVDLVVSSRQQPAGMTWSGSIDVKHLGAQSDGRALSWANPLSIQFATHETKDALVLDRAQCTSSFLQLDAAGSIDDLTASAEFDLARLVTELRQFSDLGGAQLAGRGQGRLTWKRLANDEFTAQGEFQASGFQLVAGGGQAWKEDKVVARLGLGGKLSANSVKRVERAELAIEAGGERLQARLQEPITDPAAATWPVQCSWQGQLAAWSPRLESGLGLAGWDLGGTGALQATLRCSSQAVEISQAKADIAQFRAWGHGWFISEPSLSMSAEGRWDIAKSRIGAALCSAAAGKATATLSQVGLQSTDRGWTLDVDKARIDADLAQYYRWQHDPRTPPEWQVSGRLRGEAGLKHEQGVTAGRVDATIDQWQLLALARPAARGATATDWRERQITLSAIGNYQLSTDEVKLEKVQIASDALHCDASGTIPLSQQGGDIDLKGTAEYDWSKLALLLRPYLGQSVQITGRQARAFAVRGRLTGSLTDSQSWQHIAGEGALGWSGMEIYGLRVGPGELAAKLADGQLRGQPMDVQVSEGRFTFTPLARLSPAPAELQITRGPLLTDIHLTPEMCARGLKFVAPILSEATVAEGRFSISTDGGRIPLADPGAGDASGRMTMRAQVKAGPVGQEFMLLVNEISSILKSGSLVTRNDQASALMSIDTSQIEFRLVNRRVYHRGLKFMAGTLPITTHGSVGLDETLSLVAEVPIQAKLLGRDLSLGALEGQTLQIPIEGTLTKPKLDRHILEQLAGKFLQNAARGALLDEVNKQLDRLLPRP
jgi:hypothetical protein